MPADDERASTNTAHDESSHPEPETRRLTWGSGWSVSIQPVFSGAPMREGTGTVHVDEWAAGPGRLRYEFPPHSLSIVPPPILTQSKGFVRSEPLTGTIDVSIPGRARPILTPPSLWPGGESEAPGSLLWLPPETLKQLRANRESEIEIAPLPGGVAMQSKSAPGKGSRRLRVVTAGEAVLQVDGQQTRFPVIKLEDDNKGSYTVINSDLNPLVIRFRFGTPAIAGDRELVTGSQAGYDVVALFSSKVE